MGTSAQQHRVSIGLFYNKNIIDFSITNKVKMCCRRECGDVGYKICYSVLGVLYFYLLLYILYMVLDVSQSASASHNSSKVKALPDLRNSINLYFLLAVCTALKCFIGQCEIDADLSCLGKLLALCKALALKIRSKPQDGLHWMKHLLNICSNIFVMFVTILNLSF